MRPADMEGRKGVETRRENGPIYRRPAVKRGHRDRLLSVTRRMQRALKFANVDGENEKEVQS